MTTSIDVVKDSGSLTWRALHDGKQIGIASAWVRPDGRCSLSASCSSDEALARLIDQVTAALPHELLINVDERDRDLRDRYRELGFVENVGRPY